MQTTVTFETEDLIDVDLPIFMSFIAHPGFNTTCLESFGFDGGYDLFDGKRIYANGSTLILWGDDEDELSIQSRLLTIYDNTQRSRKISLKASIINVGITLTMSSQDLN